MTRDQVLDRIGDYPHVVAQVQESWGTREGREYLISLTVQSREHPRQGFPPPIFSAIHYLIQLHDELYPHCIVHQPFRPWSRP